MDLTISESQFGDDELGNLATLHSLESLDINGCAVRNVGPAIAQIKTLLGLNLEGTQVDDAQIPHLSSLPRLKSLYLSGTNVTAKGIASLKGLTTLKKLDLSELPVSRENLEMIATMDLENLGLMDVRLDHESVLILLRMWFLERLILSRDCVSKSDLATIRRLLGRRTEIEVV